MTDNLARSRNADPPLRLVNDLTYQVPAPASDIRLQQPPRWSFQKDERFPYCRVGRRPVSVDCVIFVCFQWFVCAREGEHWRDGREDRELGGKYSEKGV